MLAHGFRGSVHGHFGPVEVLLYIMAGEYVAEVVC